MRKVRRAIIFALIASFGFFEGALWVIGTSSVEHPDTFAVLYGLRHGWISREIVVLTLGLVIGLVWPKDSPAIKAFKRRLADEKAEF